MTRKLCSIILLLGLAIFQTSAQENDNLYNPLYLEHDGDERVAHIYEPDSEPNAIMIALHSYYSSGRALEAISGLNTIADERGWVIAYPESLQSYWDDGRASVELPPADGAVDDAGYLAALADELRATYDVETVYLTGLAQGGTMAITAICDYPDHYDGVAIVSATMWAYQQSSCTNDIDAIDMLYIKGTDDHIFWNNNRPIANNDDWTILGIGDTYDFWASKFGCSLPEESIVEDSSLLISSCDNETTFAILPVLEGSNNWMREGDYQLNRVGLDTATIIGAFFGGDDDWQTTTVQNNIPTGNPRSYALYVPTTYDPTTPTPVVLSLHGRGANNFSQALVSGWNEVAEEHGFIVVYPQAYDPNFDNPDLADAVWNYNLDISLLDNNDRDDDLFLDQLVDDLAQDLNIDMSRLYVNGLSNGGYMTHRLACTRPDRYAAFATMAANAPFGLTEICEAGKHAPVLIYHGTDDTISPWRGATIQAGSREIYILAPIPNTLAFWVNQNECDTTYTQTELPSDDPDSYMIVAQYANCPEDSAVELHAVVGGGHIWHGARDQSNDFLGEVNMDVNASEAIWDFYSQYSLEGRTGEAQTTSNETTFTGQGIPQIPLPVTVRDFPPDSPQGQVIEALRNGGLTIYFALDLAEEISCETYLPDEELIASYELTSQVFDALALPVRDLFSLEDCRAEAVTSEFTRVTTRTATYNFENLPDLLLQVPDAGTLHIVVGSSAQISSILNQEIPAGYSVLIQSNRSAFQPLAVIPPDGWLSLTGN